MIAFNGDQSTPQRISHEDIKLIDWSLYRQAVINQFCNPKEHRTARISVMPSIIRRSRTRYIITAANTFMIRDAANVIMVY